MTELAKDVDIFETRIVLSSDSNRSYVFCTRMLKLSPDSYYPYWKLAHQLRSQGQYQKAKQKLKRAISLSLHPLDLYDDWVYALYFQREFEEAILLAEKCNKQLSSEYNIQNTVGVCFLHLGDYENAIKCFKNAIQIKNNYGLGYFNWALALYLQGKTEEALEKSEKAYKLRGFPMEVYVREVHLLQEDLKREENKIFEDFIKAKIEGFEYFIERGKARVRAN